MVEEIGFIVCPNERRMPISTYGKINIYQLNNVSECNEIGFPQCDNSTCFSADYLSCNDNKCVICTSFCSDYQYCQSRSVFQCADNSYIFQNQFCDGIVDCNDGSDEIVNKPGFKCSQCVLPQNNLYDSFAHCDDKSDLCLFTNNASCFQCLDGRLRISSKQVCDGVNDCYDLSDECLCDIYFDSRLCANFFERNSSLCFKIQNLAAFRSSVKLFSTNNPTNSPTVTCSTKYGSIQATPCDGRPECRDYRDECECNNLSPFCKDSCHHYFPMGDRYCDGVEDPAWIYLNNSVCPKGFDEQLCPKRFKCNATGYVSIDVLQVCDGKRDCDDGFDENYCSVEENTALFSFDTEMIANPVLKAFFWIIGFLVLLGNAFVIVSTATYFKRNRVLNILGFERLIILNISIADIIIGIYLLTIAIYSVVFSGVYGSMDQEWRSSLRCSIVGSLAVISSQTSCFLRVILVAFVLLNMYHPIKSLLPWIISIVAIWFLSILFGIVPILHATSAYFLHSISFFSRFHRNGYFDVAQLRQFMCRYALLSNITVNDNENVLGFIETLHNNFSGSAPVRVFGYYGESSICLPRFFTALGEPAWEFTVSLITINLLCFVFIVVAYVFISKHSSDCSTSEGGDGSMNASVQKRVAWILVVDLLCWVPICIMVYVRLSIDFSNIVYPVTAAILLPMNSLFNAVLFHFSNPLINGCCLKRHNRASTTNSDVKQVIELN